MFVIDRVLLVAALLVVLGVAASKVSARYGVPVLVLFVGIGMLAGSEGIGGIAFDDYRLAHGAGTIALAVILFDGGLRTPFQHIRHAIAPALSLATVGVLVTAAIAGVAAASILGVPPVYGLLLGSIVASTDAAAVFSVLRSTGLQLSERVNATLELESGSNDPMAVFLTISLLEVLLGKVHAGAGLLLVFAEHMVIGAVIGVGVGLATAWATNRIRLGTEGLYPVLVSAAGILAYGLAATLHGSGFLAVYLAGMAVASRRVVFQRGILVFHDGVAWLAQVCMFVLLGLLSSPSRLLAVAAPKLLITAVLVLVARPLAVALSLAPLRFRWREIVFISWAGLKGAVPIVLATFPLLLGLRDSEPLFDVVFFVVLVSALLQGWTLGPLARLLKLETPHAPAPAMSLEITSLQHVHGDIVQYTLSDASRVAGRTVRELALPDGVVVAMIARANRIVPPRGSTRLRGGDHVFLVLTPGVRPLADRIFSGETAEAQRALPTEVEFPLRGDTTVAEVEEFYGIAVDGDPAHTLEEVLRERLGERLEEGRGVTVGAVKLKVRRITDGRVEQVGLVVREDAEAGSN
ncbi:MAG TPA: potassium/proton antiporter [Longimicrobium sp.]|nr:potassium/proton antiporter [Longimicrobium sp.]